MAIKDQNQYEEPEERDDISSQVADNFNPLGEEPVIEKAYTRPNVRLSTEEINSEIPEPNFIPPPMNDSGKDQEKKKEEEPFNQEMKDIPKKDKMDAAAKMAKMIMSGYKSANAFVDKSLLFDERKLAKLQRDGQIDLNVSIPVSPSEILSAKDFIEEYNNQTQGTITVSAEFEEDVMPVLTRVLAKRGAGLTDEQYLLYAVSKDVLSKSFLVSASLSAKKEILEVLKDFSKNNINTAQPMPQQPQATVYQEPIPTPAEVVVDDEVIQQKPYDETNVNDFVNKMTGGIAEQENQPNPPLRNDDQKDKKRRGRPSTKDK